MNTFYLVGNKNWYVLSEYVRINRIIYNGSDRRKNRLLQNSTYYPRVRLIRVRINRIIYNGSDRRKNRLLQNSTYYPRVRLKPSTYCIFNPVSILNLTHKFNTYIIYQYNTQTTV